MDINGVFSAIGVGIVCGLLGRMLVRSYQPVGCIMTIILGIIGAAIGLWLGNSVFKWNSFWLVFFLQVVLSAVVIGIFVAATGRRSVD
jgi:uncharacterized membrane protein YeaQ/YmgE (transglycosylase-associated protein family)